MGARLGAVLLSLVLIAAAAAGLAQGAASSADMSAWRTTAERAEQVLAVGAASDGALSQLREEITAYRTGFQSSINASAARLQTVRNRLAALPEPPAEGETESPVIAEERARLEELRTRLQTPSIEAQLAFAHADGLVREIDDLLRLRQARSLTERLPTPLNLLNWGLPLQELGRVFADVPGEISRNLASALKRRLTLEKLPMAGVLLVLGAGLLIGTGPWSARFHRAADRRGVTIWGAVLSGLATLGQLVLPITGLFIVLAAVTYLDVLGDTGLALFEAAAAMASFAIFSYWLLARVFTREDGRFVSATGLLPEDRVPAARRVSLALVGVLAMQAGLDSAVQSIDLDKRTVGYLSLIIVVLLAPLVFRLGQLYRSDSVQPASVPDGDPADPSASPRPHFIARVVGSLAGASRLLAVLGAVAGCLGYVNGADFIVVGAAQSFLFFAAMARALIMVQRMVALFRGRPGERDTGLVATLVSALLVVLSLPLIALIWGARPTDLTELWTQFIDGVSIGDVTLSPTTLLVLGVVFAAVFLFTRLVQGVLADTILPKTTLEIGAQRAITSGVGYVGVFLAGLLAVSVAGLNLSSLAIVAGALSVGIGFGLQTIVSNFVSGIILLIERPVAEGDWIEVGGKMGYVRAISVRSTRIETFDRTDVIVPNSDLIANPVTNWTRGNLIGRAIIPVGVAYGTDTQKVERVLREIAEAHPMVAIRPPPQVLFMSFGESALRFEIRAILRDVNFLLSVTSEINHAIARRFAEEGIEIPFPQRDVWLRQPAGTGPAGPERAGARRSDGDLLEPDDLDGAAGDGDGGGDGGGDGDGR